MQDELGGPPSPPDPSSAGISVTEAARRLGMSATAVRLRIAAGRLRA